MVNLAAKSTDAHFEGAFSWAGAVRLAVVQVGSGSYVCLEGPSLLSLSLVVPSANLIVALISSVFGFHFSRLVDVVVRIRRSPPALALIHNSYRWGQRQAIEPQERST